MVETSEPQAQQKEYKQITLQYNEGKAVPLNTKLQNAYTVWAMVKQ
jgi:hypothetical protein